MFDLDSLNPQQREATVTHRGPVLILAGAGTGKTRVITCRIVHMIERGIRPSQVLAVTFTNKAAREMLQRVNEMLPRARSSSRDNEPPERPTLCTFHSLCVRILRQHIEKLGYKRNFVIYDESDQLAAIKKILAAIQNGGEKTDPAAVLALISKFRNGGSRAAEFTNPNVRALAEHVVGRYQSALHACNAVDFDDLILLVLRLFREHPEALERCRERFRYVMVDEYQDTNSAQFELVHSLTCESRNLCVVGDDDQSIYGWRGAEVANLLDLEKHFPEVKVIKLEQNYRSTNVILRAANAVIRHNARRRGKQLWSAQGEGEKILLQCFDTDEEEAKTVAQNIEDARLVQRVRWGDQAILFRTNIQARPLETALRQLRIRYRLIGGQSFFDRREIRDFLAYLRALLNPHDDVALLRIANTPARGLSDVTMERLLAASQERKSSVFTAMRHTDVQGRFQARTGEAIREFVHFIETTRAPLEAKEPLSLGNWAEEWLNAINFQAELRRLEKTAEAAESRWRNVWELLAELDDPSGVVVQRELSEAIVPSSRPESASESTDAPVLARPAARRRVSRHPGERVAEFLEQLSLDQEREADQDTGDQVTLITIHAAKGLEFRHVQIVGVEDGLLPHSRSKVEGTLDEERRLFYVAITRAQRTLRISHCLGRKRYGQVMPCHPSPFLKELPEDCVEDAETAGVNPVASEAGSDLFSAMRAALDD
ncbi:MAG TPA: UvrD-helicase domain-containing protein [Verrucomicrobiota bacterium]|nr:DNA helicase UvrD [Verrucomicrobiales bacterium]HRI16102.1 UvrD-helicase domain-containing protein [Verrucomicrobiota bacterium]